jgi:hypothetical protein
MVQNYRFCSRKILFLARVRQIVRVIVEGLGPPGLCSDLDRSKSNRLHSQLMLQASFSGLSKIAG